VKATAALVGLLQNQCPGACFRFCTIRMMDDTGSKEALEIMEHSFAQLQDILATGFALVQVVIHPVGEARGKPPVSCLGLIAPGNVQGELVASQFALLARTLPHRRSEEVVIMTPAPFPPEQLLGEELPFQVEVLQTVWITPTKQAPEPLPSAPEPPVLPDAPPHPLLQALDRFIELKEIAKTPDAAVCDVCSAELISPEGHLLTTTQVVQSPEFWQHHGERFQQTLAKLGMEPDSTQYYLTMLRDAHNPTPWLICEGCVSLFAVKPKKTRELAARWWQSGKTFAPPGSGPAPLTAVQFQGAGAMFSPATNMALRAKLLMDARAEAAGAAPSNAPPEPILPLNMLFLWPHVALLLGGLYLLLGAAVALLGTPATSGFWSAVGMFFLGLLILGAGAAAGFLALRSLKLLGVSGLGPVWASLRKRSRLPDPPGLSADNRHQSKLWGAGAMGAAVLPIFMLCLIPWPTAKTRPTNANRQETVTSNTPPPSVTSASGVPKPRRRDFQTTVITGLTRQAKVQDILRAEAGRAQQANLRPFLLAATSDGTDTVRYLKQLFTSATNPARNFVPDGLKGAYIIQLYGPDTVRKLREAGYEIGSSPVLLALENDGTPTNRRLEIGTWAVTSDQPVPEELRKFLETGKAP
jgi:hypothetical protein